jgi:hypothetical protein
MSNGPVEINRNTQVSNSYHSEKSVQGRAVSRDTGSFPENTASYVKPDQVISNYGNADLKVSVEILLVEIA